MGRFVVVPTAADIRAADRLVRVVPVKGKGMGVLARRNIDAFVPIGPYPGERFSNLAHSKRLAAGLTDGKYAVEFWKLQADGMPRCAYVIDPGSARGTLVPPYDGAVTPLVNEPSNGGPNLMWVWNLPGYRIELWTARPVREGEELTLCYGTDGGYPREYKTSCCPGNEPELHVISRVGERPVPWSAWRRS